ncbi:MAG TPA: L,D-transpeptidase family protein [Caulobacteraceae bacterium]|nr:L,D-transpeptidase family protein [Caulobacteraceae bacterium]
MEGPDRPQRRCGHFVRGLIICALACAALTGCGKLSGGGATAPVSQPAFSRGDLKAALAALGDAPAQGFAPNAFGDVAQITALARSGDEARKEQGGGALRKGLIVYARAEHGLGLSRDQFPKEWGIRPGPYDAGAELDQAIAQHRFTAWLAALPPQAPRYQSLVQALAAYRGAAAHGGWAPIPDGPALRRGSRSPRVAALRARLASENPALGAAAAPGAPAKGAAAPSPADIYDGVLAKAVADAQVRYGIKPTAVADSGTIAALNVPLAARVGQIRANLERWRWLPRPLPATRVEVDAATGSMDYYVNGAPVLHMLAAAGKPGDETPMVISTITQIEFNPPWKVPADIAEKELFPKEAAHPGYFARNDFVRGTTDAAPLVQKAGPKSALGRVKFEFDNPYGIYLHDTPAKAAFTLDQRQVSHGCVRLQRATDLAKALLAPSGWPPERVDETIAGEDTSSVKLTQRTPVAILYWTAYAQGGKMYFRQDPYGWDDLLVRLLDAPARSNA